MKLIDVKQMLVVYMFNPFEIQMNHVFDRLLDA